MDEYVFSWQTYLAGEYEIIPGADVFVQIHGRHMRRDSDSPWRRDL